LSFNRKPSPTVFASYDLICIVDGEKKDRNARLSLFYLPSGVKAREDRQTNIEKNQVRIPFESFLDGFLPVCGLRAFNMSARLQKSDDTRPYDFVIVSNQNSQLSSPRTPIPGCADTLVMGGQREQKYRVLVRWGDIQGSAELGAGSILSRE
jgi:hypothetical protein